MIFPITFASVYNLLSVLHLETEFHFPITQLDFDPRVFIVDRLIKFEWIYNFLLEINNLEVYYNFWISNNVFITLRWHSTTLLKYVTNKQTIKHSIQTHADRSNVLLENRVVHMTCNNRYINTWVTFYCTIRFPIVSWKTIKDSSNQNFS